jgi:hypothetical protein
MHLLAWDMYPLGRGLEGSGVEYDEMLVDMDPPSLCSPIDAAEELVETPFTVDLRLDGSKVTAKVYVA